MNENKDIIKLLLSRRSIDINKVNAISNFNIK